METTKIRHRALLDSVTLAIFFIGYALGWLAWWGRAEEYPQIAISGMQSLSVVCLWVAILILLKKRGRLLLSLGSFRIKLTGFCVFFLLMLVVGIPNYVEHDGEFIEMIGLLTIDFGAFAFYLSPLVLALLTKSEWRWFLHSFFLLVLAIFLGTYSKMDVAQAASYLDRSGVYRDVGWMTYSLQVGVTSALIPLTAIGLFLGRSRLTTLYPFLAVGLIVFMSLYYSKRQGLAESFLLLAFISMVWVNRKASFIGWWTSLSAIILTFFVLRIVGFESDLTLLAERLVLRLSEFGSIQLEDFDRFRESQVVFSNAPLYKILLTGHGFSANPEYGRKVLHIGFANLVMKGGLFFALFIASCLVSNIVRALRSKTLPHRSLVLFLSGFTFLHLTYAPLWGISPSLLLAGLGLFAPEFVRLHASAPQPSKNERLDDVSKWRKGVST